MFLVIASAMGFGVLSVGLEDKLKALLPPKADPLALPMAVAILHIFVLQWLGFMVNNARVRYDVKWPWLYADKDHPNAVAYNCAQRAHQHVLEQTVLAGIVLVVASTEYPCSAGAGIGLFSFSKIIGNVFGYASGNAKRRNWGGFGYLGLLPVVGLAILATIKKFGVEPDAAAAAVAEVVGPYATMAMETAQPYATMAMEKAQPYATMAMETAAPYVEAAKAKMKM
jgi:glutathione S-transferase